MVASTFGLSIMTIIDSRGINRLMAALGTRCKMKYITIPVSERDFTCECEETKKQDDITTHIFCHFGAKVFFCKCHMTFVYVGLYGRFRYSVKTHM